MSVVWFLTHCELLRLQENNLGDIWKLFDRIWTFVQLPVLNEQPIWLWSIYYRSCIQLNQKQEFSLIM